MLNRRWPYEAGAGFQTMIFGSGALAAILFLGIRSRTNKAASVNQYEWFLPRGRSSLAKGPCEYT